VAITTALGDDLAGFADVDVGRVEPDVHERMMAQPAGPRCGLSASMPLRIRDTELLEIPVSQPRALTRSSTFLVDVPVM
jgi:hypothetical protein